VSLDLTIEIDSLTRGGLLKEVLTRMAKTLWSSNGVRTLYVLLALFLLVTRHIQAQEAPAIEPAAPPEAEAPAAPPTVVLIAPPPEAAPPPALPPLLETTATTPPPTEQQDVRKSAMTLAAWMHMSNRLQNPNNPKRMTRFSQDNEFDLLFNAQIIPQVAMTASLIATYGPTSATDGAITGNVALMDLIAKLDLDDAFHLWAGRMLVPSDRSNFSGVWFMAPWYYPGRYYGPTPTGGSNNYYGAPIGPRQGPAGRNDGATIWGQAKGGMLKYYAGAYDLYDSGKNPLLSGRLNLALINPEPGYYHSSTYYGTKDILALAIGGQYQKSKGGAADYSEFNADLLFEKNLNGAGTIDIEGAFYKYFGDPTDFSYFLLASYLIPMNVGPGGLQPLVRFQSAKPKAGGDTWTQIDAQIGYVVEAYATRFALGIQHSTVAGLTANALYLGVQLQK
jgi:hypothetical protein